MTVSPTATVTSPPTSATSSSSSSSSSSTGTVADTTMIADNFNTFLTLLTTQLKNQNPLDPLDTNQFTQQLVQFAQVEQQMKGNDQLKTLVSLQQSAQATTALNYVGSTVVVDGANSSLANGAATWTMTSTKPATGTATITDSTGQTVYTGTVSLNAGAQTFSWDGHSNNGVQRPDGVYTMTITATDASKQPVAVSTESQGTVDSVDLTQNPPVLSVNGQSYTLDKVKRILRPGA
jgi:flagellar basal-body rod modification protein FlgD